MRALKAVVFIWIAVVGPLSLVAVPAFLIFVQMAVTDPLDRLVWSWAAILTWIFSGYAPWIIAERIRKHEAARVQQPAGRSVALSGAGVPRA